MKLTDKHALLAMFAGTLAATNFEAYSTSKPGCKLTGQPAVFGRQSKRQQRRNRHVN